MFRADTGAREFVTGLLLGGIAGVAIGMLLAPRAGGETREALMERGIELTGRIFEGPRGAAGGTAAGGSPVEAATGPVEDLVERARTQVTDALQRTRSTFERAVEEGREEARRTQQELQADFDQQVRREGRG